MTDLPPLDQAQAYVVVGPNDQRGPYTLDLLIGEVLAGRLHDATPVWWPGLAEWTTMSSHPGVAAELARRRAGYADPAAAAPEAQAPAPEPGQYQQASYGGWQTSAPGQATEPVSGQDYSADMYAGESVAANPAVDPTPAAEPYAPVSAVDEPVQPYQQAPAEPVGETSQTGESVPAEVTGGESADVFSTSPSPDAYGASTAGTFAPQDSGHDAPITSVPTGTDQAGTDQAGTDQAGTDQAGTYQAGQLGTDPFTPAESGSTGSAEPAPELISPDSVQPAAGVDPGHQAAFESLVERSRARTAGADSVAAADAAVVDAVVSAVESQGFRSAERTTTDTRYELRFDGQPGESVTVLLGRLTGDDPEEARRSDIPLEVRYQSSEYGGGLDAGPGANGQVVVVADEWSGQATSTVWLRLPLEDYLLGDLSVDSVALVRDVGATVAVVRSRMS